MMRKNLWLGVWGAGRVCVWISSVYISIKRTSKKLLSLHSDIAVYFSCEWLVELWESTLQKGAFPSKYPPQQLTSFFLQTAPNTRRPLEVEWREFIGENGAIYSPTECDCYYRKLSNDFPYSHTHPNGAGCEALWGNQCDGKSL